MDDLPLPLQPLYTATTLSIEDFTTLSCDEVEQGTAHAGSVLEHQAMPDTVLTAVESEIIDKRRSSDNEPSMHRKNSSTHCKVTNKIINVRTS